MHLVVLSLTWGEIGETLEFHMETPAFYWRPPDFHCRALQWRPLTETPDFLLEIPRFLLKTLDFRWRPPYFHWDPRFLFGKIRIWKYSVSLSNDWNFCLLHLPSGNFCLLHLPSGNIFTDFMCRLRGWRVNNSGLCMFAIGLSETKCLQG